MAQPLPTALALVLCCLLASSVHILAQDGSDKPTAVNQTGCGMLNAVCCQLQISDQVVQSVCNTQGLHCDYGGSSEKCVAVPAGCGREGAACCPGNSGVPYCTDASTACLPKNTTAAADHEEGASEGVCRRFTADACGQPGGLCAGAWPSAWLPPPAPQCPSDKRQCPAGYYCWRPLPDSLGVCNPLPPNCGQEGARCCPPGYYGAAPGQPNRNVTAPYCNDSNRTHVYCTGWGGLPDEGVCQYWPQYPSECGRTGKRCCNSPYHNWMDAATPPPICEQGSWCNGFNENGTCVRNPDDCGQVGKPCCVSTGGCCTNFLCRPGAYCPYGELEASNNNPTCKACPSKAESEKQNLYLCLNPPAGGEINAPGGAGSSSDASGSGSG